MFGSKSESLDQLNLVFDEDEQIAGAAKDRAKFVTLSDEGKPDRNHSRKPLPEHLDRHEEILSPGEDCFHCGGCLRKPGEDVTEELEYVPGRFIVNRIVRPRMACPCCEAIMQSPLPSRPIERGKPPADRAALRQASARPVFDGLESWLHAQLPRISGKSPLAQAIRYALGRMPKARPYLDHGIPELDTDVVEQPFSQLFCGFGGFSRQASIIFA